MGNLPYNRLEGWDMVELFQTAVYLSGGLTFYCLLALPALVLLGFSAVYIVLDIIWTFRERRGW